MREFFGHHSGCVADDCNADDVLCSLSGLISDARSAVRSAARSAARSAWVRLESQCEVGGVITGEGVSSRSCSGDRDLVDSREGTIIPAHGQSSGSQVSRNDR